MRHAFVKFLLSQAHEDKNVFLLTGDLGFSVFEPFQQRYPDRFINAGISEQNMASLAAGMALAGKTVYVYSIANFPTIRCLEQIRNDIAHHKCKVIIIAVGGGLAYGGCGMSHHATEDIAIMRTIPGVNVYVPCDPREVVACLMDANKHDGPSYIRLNKAGEPVLNEHKEINAGKLQKLREGTSGACILATGAIVEDALAVSNAMLLRGISLEVWSVPCIKPLDVGTVEQCALRHNLLITVEEHSIIGGLGSAICEVVAGMKTDHGRVIRIGLDGDYSSIVGGQAYLKEEFGISAGAIFKQLEGEMTELGMMP